MGSMFKLKKKNKALSYMPLDAQDLCKLIDLHEDSDLFL
jgi:hypothetical protein